MVKRPAPGWDSSIDYDTHRKIREDDEGLSDVRKDVDGERLVKSRVVHIRVDMEMWRAVRAAALRVDRKPCAWVRRAIQKELKIEEKRRKRR